MNRLDFQNLSSMRLREARALLAAGFPEGAYYLAGYAVECALKSCIAKQTREFDFPEKDSKNYYTHSLEDLFKHAKLKTDLENETQMDALLRTNWSIVKNWSEQSRYDQGKTAQEAADLLEAIESQKGGVLTWVQLRW